MLSKKYLFRRGLYLGSAIAICLHSISSDVVAGQGIRNLRSELNQISWNLFCNDQEHRIQNANQKTGHKDDGWVLDDSYTYSRIAVIGKAIGDCVAGENEFSGRSAEDIIIFSGQEPERYTPSNWNAVILYNYVHKAINAPMSLNGDNYMRYFSNVKAALQNKLPMIKNAYATRYRNKRSKNADELIKALNKNLDKAIQDIQHYVNALNLNYYLLFFRKSKFDYARSKSIEALAPQVLDCSDEHREAVSFSSPFSPVETGTEITHMEYRPILRYHEGELYLQKLYVTKKIWDKNSQGWKQLPNTQLSTSEQLTHCEWMLERLGTVVKRPSKELFNMWKEELYELN